MKLLRNPIVSGILAVVALVVVYIQVLAPNLHFSRPRVVPVPVSAAPSPASPGQAVPAASPQDPIRSTGKVVADSLPTQPTDRQFVEVHFDGWVNWPRRDPFLLIIPDALESKSKEPEPVGPVNSWKLNAIWVQEGVRVAVVNGRAYREGEVLQGYKVIKIEGDEVWFQGPRRKERLGFDRRLPAHP